MRNGRLKRIEAIIEWQQRMLAERDDHSLLLKRQDCRPRLFGAGRQIGNGCPLPPHRNRLLIDPIVLGKRPQALLTILYCSTATDCLSRGGAAV